MQEKFISNGWYGMGLVDGSYAVNIKNKGYLETHAGTLNHPYTDILYLFITNKPHFKICGQAWDGSGDVVWDGEWKGSGKSHGVNPVAFDGNGNVVVNTGVEAGSQGWRYIGPDGRLVTCDSTKDVWNGLNERIQVGHLWIGQANDDRIGGALVWDGSVLRRLATGDCTFMRKDQEGDRVCITITKPDGVLILQTTVSELSNLPVVSLPSNPPKEEPKPEEPKPMPEVKSLIKTVEAVRAKYGPRPSDEELGKMLNEIAWIHRADGWGLSEKPSGTNAPSPQGKMIAHDVLHKMPEDLIFDVFIAAGAEATPTWNLVEHHRNTSRPWLAPIKPEGLEEPEPEPKPEEPKPEPEKPQEPDYTAILEMILDKIAEVVKAEVDDLRKELDNIEFEGRHKLLGTMTFKRKK